MVALGLRRMLVFLFTLSAVGAGNELEEKIKQLGSPDFRERKEASLALWELGRSAAASLAAAAESDGAEASQRASVLLHRINLRIPPDSPPEIVSLVDRYPSLEPGGRKAALKKLIEAKYSYAFLKLWSDESDPGVKEEMEGRIAASLDQVLQVTLEGGDLAESEELIRLFPDHPNAPGWTANLYMVKGLLPGKIAELESADQKDNDLLLLACYRRLGDLDKALALAKKLGRKDVIASLSLFAGDGIPYLKWRENLKSNGSLQKTVIKILRLQEEGLDAEALVIAKSLLKDATESKSSTKREYLYRILHLAGYFELTRESMVKNKSPLLSRLYSYTFDTEKKIGEFSLPEKKEDQKKWLEKRVKKIIKSGDLQSKEAGEILFSASSLVTLGDYDLAREILAPVQSFCKKSGENLWREYLGRLPSSLRYPILIESIQDDWKEPNYLHLVEQFYASDKDDKILFWKALARQEDLSLRQRFDEMATFFGWSYSSRKARNETWQRLMERGRGDDDLLDLMIRRGVNREPLSIVGEAMLARAHRFEELNAKQQWLTVKQFVYLRDWDRAHEFLSKMEEPEKKSPGLVAGILKRSGREVEGEKVLQEATHRAIANLATLPILAGELVQTGCLRDASKLRRRIALELPPGSSVWTGNFTWMLAEAERKQDRARGRAMSLAMVLSMVQGSTWNDSYENLSADFRLKIYRGLDLIDAGKKQEGHEMIDRAMKPLIGSSQLTDALISRIDPKDYPELYDHVFESSYQRITAVVEKHPHYAHARNSVAWICAISERHLEEAKQHSLISVKKYPKGAYYDTLARIHRGLGNRDEELKWQEYAVKHSSYNYFSSSTNILSRYDWILENPQGKNPN